MKLVPCSAHPLDSSRLVHECSIHGKAPSSDGFKSLVDKSKHARVENGRLRPWKHTLRLTNKQATHHCIIALLFLAGSNYCWSGIDF